MPTLFKLIHENIAHRDQLWSLARTHQKIIYRGSDMGMFWAICKPTMYIVVFYVALSIGFRSSKDIPGIVCPYFVWLAIGMISFFYMRDMILNGASCFRKYGAFVTNLKYPMETLPTTVSLSYFFIHLEMLGMGILISVAFGNYPSIYWLQLPFYMFFMFLFCVFWSIATGLISVIYKDFYNFLQVINQAIFWLSGILFDVNGLGPRGQKIFMFNPITYIVEGYRNSFCRHVWFWEEPVKLACFMIMFVIMAFIAVIMYKKLRKRIPDIL